MKEDVKKMMRRKVLDAYFALRRPMPEDGYIQQVRTTEEIQDDMVSMMDISKDLRHRLIFLLNLIPGCLQGCTRPFFVLF